MNFYDVPINDLVVSGVQLANATEGFAILQWFGLGFLLVDHVLNWFADLVAYKVWNIKHRLTDAAGFGTDKGLTTKLEAVLTTVKEKMPMGDAERAIALQRLDEIKTEVIRLNTFSGWYLVIWMVVPIMCCVVALLWDR